MGEYDRGAATALWSEKSNESPVIADELIVAIAEVVSIPQAAQMDAILEDFRAKMNREDIVIRFYEDCSVPDTGAIMHRFAILFEDGLHL